MVDQHPIPLSLYVHFPWCIQKCPYCDFNSHKVENTTIPEQAYISALLADLENDLTLISKRPISTIFFGGGTPSLISGFGMKFFLGELRKKVTLQPDVEITLEANPGTVDSEHFSHYRNAGVNRLSIGVQSFRDQSLKSLGRIHSAQEAISAYKVARAVGFENINLDLMFGLPEDDLQGCLFDLEQAIALKPEHISWYQLTMEPNTLFYQQRPNLPKEDLIWEFQQAGQTRLSRAGYAQYEISAYANRDLEAQHNLNYWNFGDYLGIGAGAHSKISSTDLIRVERFSKPRSPKQYLNDPRLHVQARYLQKPDLILEFMMNALRLNKGFSNRDFEMRTGLNLSELESMIGVALEKGLLQLDDLKQKQDIKQIKPTPKGHQFLNDLLAIFS